MALDLADYESELASRLGYEEGYEDGQNDERIALMDEHDIRPDY